MRLLFKHIILAGFTLSVTTTLTACTDKHNADNSTQEAQQVIYPELVKLHDSALNLQNDFDTFTNDPASVRGAWLTLQNLADVTIAENGKVHPLAGVARIKIAGIDYEEGKIIPAIKMSEEALDILSTVKEEYMTEVTEGVALLSIMYSQTGEAEKALELQKQAILDFQIYFQGLSKAEKTRAVIVSKSNIEFSHAQTLMRLGRFDEAIDAQKMSLDTRRENLGEDDPDTIGSLYGFAQVLIKGGKLELAEKYARLAMERATTTLPENHVSYARSLEMLGIVLSRRGQRLEAVNFLSRALEIKRRTVGVENLYFAYGVHNLGNILMNLERYDDAEPLLVDADIGFRANQGENSPFAATALVYAANAAYVLGHDDTAIDRLRTAMPRLKYAENNTDETYLLAQLTLAKIYIRKQNYKYAQDTLMGVSTSATTESINLAHAHALQAYLTYLQNNTGRDALTLAAQSLKNIILASQYINETGDLSFEIQPPMETMMEISASLQEPELAMEIAELILSSKMSKASRQSALRVTANDEQLATYLRALQDARANFTKADRDLLIARSKNKNVQAAITQFNTAKDAVGLASKQLSQAYPRWAELSPDSNISLHSIQKNLMPTEALIGIIPVFSQTFTVLITKDTARLVQLNGTRLTHETLVKKIRASIQSDAFDRTAAHNLYNTLLPKSVQTPLTGKDHYRIVTSGAFTTLPFSVLITDNDPVTPKWLVQQAATTVEPSLNINPASQKNMATNVKFLGIGSPNPFLKKHDVVNASPINPAQSSGGISTYFRGGGVNYQALADLPNLPGSAAEIKDIAKALAAGNSKILLGKKANEEALSKLNLADYSVIAFATHALVAGEMDGIAEPAMVLTPPKNPNDEFDGVLKASEIATLNLKADWVILSACNTAAGDGTDGSGYSGLARAFLYAGADSLLVSHWPVRDDAAAYLTVNTVQNTQNGMSKAKALQKAMLDLMEDDDIDQSSTPNIWAPFVVVGN